MLNGIASNSMSSGHSLNTPISEGDKEKLFLDHGQADGLTFVYGNLQSLEPVIPTTFAIRGNNSDMLSPQTDDNSLKRQVDGCDESSVPSKRNRTEPSSCDGALRGWGPNGNAVNVSDGSILNVNQNCIGSLLSNHMAQTTVFNHAAAPNAGIPVSSSMSLPYDGLSSMLYRDQMTHDQAINTMLLAKLVASNGQHDMFEASRPILNTSQNRFELQQHLRTLGSRGNLFQQTGGLTVSPLELQQLTNLHSFSQLNQRLYGNLGTPMSTSGYHPMLNEMNQGNPSSAQLNALLRGYPTLKNRSDKGNSSSEHLNALFCQLHGANIGNQQQVISTPSQGNTDLSLNNTNQETALFQVNQEQIPTTTQPTLMQRSIMDLPPCEEGPIESHVSRPSFPLGIPEDPNWLSEFHCFVRSNLVEVFRAGYDDVKIRNNSISYQQVGIRCRFCASMPHGVRSGRASAFPSSLRQIYQSFTMMLRDHFVSCEAIPSSTLEEFTSLKNKPAQGATDSKRYWIYSAKKIGMIDSSDGIMINQTSRSEGMDLPSFGTVSGQNWEDDAFRGVSLVRPGDSELVAEFLLVLLSQVQPIRLTEAECIGNRRSLRVGLPGFGCRFCCEQKRLGLCRMFPARRRTLPNKVNDLYDHLRRCSLCPQSVKDSLESSKRRLSTSFQSDQAGDREFFDRVWSRLGHVGGSDVI